LLLKFRYLRLTILNLFDTVTCAPPLPLHR
jgi:hypothetical protein